jgi:hypothetical protein
VHCNLFNSAWGTNYIMWSGEDMRFRFLLRTDPQMQAIFIASGAGVPKGMQLGEISNLDVAPTIAALNTTGLEISSEALIILT